MTGRGSPQGRGQTVLTHTTPRHCSTSEGRSNPTVYHYTRYRLNTRPGEGMTEQVVYVCASECVRLSMHFSCSSVDVCVWACWPVSPRVSSALYTSTVTKGECACQHARVYVCVMQNSLASHPKLEKKKKSHSQEATLKYQVLIWQIQATGVFTFQRLRGEKDQMPP